MTKTPDETKKGLDDPIHVHFHIGDPEPRLTPLALRDLEVLHANALALIQQLERDVSFYKNIAALNNRTIDEQNDLINQIRAERDAAVRDIKQMVHDPYEPCFCDYCKLTEEECAKSNCRGRNAFVWRGVQKEEGNGEA